MGKKRLSILFLQSFVWINGLYAQVPSGYSADSLETQKTGTDTLRLTDEVLEAIKNGTLLRLTPQHRQLKEAASDLSILKDFSEYIKPDTVPEKKFDPSIPPAVFLLYTFDSDTGLYVHREALSVSRSVVVLPDRIQLGKMPLTLTVGAQNLFLPEVRDGQSGGSIGASVRYCFSMEDVLRYIFWKSHRDKIRNRKRAFTWQHYNNYP